MKIKDLKSCNRPREKLIKYGSENLSNEELLAILINTGTKDKSAIDLASDVINSVSNIKELFNLSILELEKINGIKEKKASTILASFELCRRAMNYVNDNKCFIDAKDIYEYLYPLMASLTTESFYVMFLNSQLKLISCVKYGIGDFKGVSFSKQRIVVDALKNSSSFVVISHNHPSGNTEPSKEDIRITMDLKKALEIIEIKLIDHIIISGNKYYSFSDEKLL